MFEGFDLDMEVPILLRAVQAVIVTRTLESALDTVLLAICVSFKETSGSLHLSKSSVWVILIGWCLLAWTEFNIPSFIFLTRTFIIIESNERWFHLRKNSQRQLAFVRAVRKKNKSITNWGYYPKMTILYACVFYFLTHTSI